MGLMMGLIVGLMGPRGLLGLWVSGAEERTLQVSPPAPGASQDVIHHIDHLFTKP